MTVSKFEGGQAFNIIPDAVMIGGTFRALSKERFMRLKNRIEEVNIFLPIGNVRALIFCTFCYLETSYVILRSSLHKLLHRGAM